MEKEGKVVLTGTYKGSYETLRYQHARRNKVRLGKMISKLLKRKNNG